MSETSTPKTPEPQFLETENGARIAYHALPGRSPGIVFLGGFLSDMTGTKAQSLETFCRQTGQAFVRFDYFGHGASSGEFTKGTISRWKKDALAVIDHLTTGPQILVGSSMGGWIMLLAALERKERVAGMVGIASAPDFTETLIHDKLSKEDIDSLSLDGIIHLASPYDNRPYPITKDLIEDARQHLLLPGPIALECPVRLLHGVLDRDVPPQISLQLAERLDSANVTVTYIKHGDHRLVDLASISHILLAVAELTNTVLAAENKDAG